MDYKNYKSEGVKLRPRRKVGESRSFGEKKSFGGERKPYGEGRSFSGERKSFDGERRQFDGERRSFGGDRKPYGERKSFGGERKSYGEGRSFGGERKPFGGERRSYGEGRSFGGERKPYGERKSYGGFSGERKSYGDNASFGGERRSFGGEHKPFDGERKSYGEGRSFGGERRQFNGERKNYGGRDFNARGKKSFGAGPRGFGAKKSISRKQYEEYSHFRSEEESGINRMIDKRRIVDTPAVVENLTPAVMSGEVRLNKFIANSGICSRREADNFILAGVVTVNGVPVTELGSKINVDTDDIRFNGERIHGEEKVYIVMNKPKGFVTTTTDPHAEKTVMDLLKGCDKRVFPVGRLDKNTTGVLMFTNDGEMAEKLTHPSYDKKKIYQVSLNHDLSDEDREKILNGVSLSDGDVCADSLEFIEDDDHRKVGIEIHSGKNRVVRRIFESLGYEVKALDRVYFAGLTKKSLKKGEWRFLNDMEVNILRMGSFA